MIREALEQYGALTGLPDEGHALAPRLTDEADEPVKAIVRLGDTTSDVGLAAALAMDAKPKPQSGGPIRPKNR